MTEQITTEVKNYIIVFFDGSKLWLTSEQYQNYINAATNPDVKKIKIGGNYYYMGGIQKVLSLEEFYREYPKERPPITLPSDRKYEQLPDYRSPRLSKTGLENIIKGLEAEIARMQAAGIEPTKALIELKKQREKYDAYGLQ